MLRLIGPFLWLQLWINKVWSYTTLIVDFKHRSWCHGGILHKIVSLVKNDAGIARENQMEPRVGRSIMNVGSNATVGSDVINRYNDHETLRRWKEWLPICNICSSNPITMTPETTIIHTAKRHPHSLISLRRLTLLLNAYVYLWYYMRFIVIVDEQILFCKNITQGFKPAFRSEARATKPCYIQYNNYWLGCI